MKGLPSKSVLTYAGTSIVSQVLRFSGILMTTKLLGLEQFGLYAQALMAIGLCGIILSPGHQDGFVAYNGEDPRYSRFHFQTALIAGLVAWMGLYGGIRIFTQELNPLRSVIPILGVIVLIESLTFTPLFIAQKRFQFRWTGLVDVTGVVVWLVLSVGLCYYFPRMESLLYGRLGEGMIRLILLYGRIPWNHLGFCLDRDVWSYYWKPFIQNAFPRAFVGSLMEKVDILMLSQFVSIHDLGIYERTQHFLQICLSLGANLIDRVSLVTYSRNQSSWIDLMKTLKSSVGFCLFSSIGVTLSITLFFPWVMGFWWEKGLVEEIYHLWIFSIGLAILKPLAVTVSLFFHGTGQSKVLLKQHFILLLILIITGLLLIPNYGTQGACLGGSFAYFCLIVVQTVEIKSFRFKFMKANNL